MRILTLSLSIAVVLNVVPFISFSQTKEEPTQKITEWGLVSEGFQLAIQTEKQEFSPQEPIWLHIYLRNSSGNSTSIFASNLWMDYSIDLKNERGERVNLTEEGKVVEQRQKDDGIAGFKEIKLLPDQVVSDRFVLNKVYDMRNSGTYSIIVKRKIPRQNNKGWTEVMSNIIKIKVGT